MKMKMNHIVSVRALFFAVALVFFTSVCGTAVAADYIGEAKARSIALTHAGVAEGDARFVDFELRENRRNAFYDIEFLANDARYEYEIDARTGEVLEYAYKFHGGKEAIKAPTGKGDEIGAERAKQIAFAHAKVDESGVYKLDIDFDEKRGRMIYEIEFKCNGMEYEYEIDAKSGEILKWKSERD